MNEKKKKTLVLNYALEMVDSLGANLLLCFGCIFVVKTFCK